MRTGHDQITPPASRGDMDTLRKKIAREKLVQQYGEAQVRQMEAFEKAGEEEEEDEEIKEAARMLQETLEKTPVPEPSVSESRKPEDSGERAAVEALARSAEEQRKGEVFRRGFEQAMRETEEKLKGETPIPRIQQELEEMESLAGKEDREAA